MKRLRTFLFPLVVILICSMACKSDDHTVETSEPAKDPPVADAAGSRLRIRIGSQVFIAILLDNPTVAAFKSRLPMTVAMTELNGNEKLHNFTESLPANASNPASILAGDLMLYGSKTLVLFYKSFSTPYSYTRLGRINDAVGLDNALGAGNVTLTFELE